MKTNEELMAYFSDENFTIDELGRMVIDDPVVLAEINGAFSSGSAVTSSLFNAACANGYCN